MQNKKKILKKKYSFFLFDLDGVIFDSKKNMEVSWNATAKNFGLKSGFKLYFKHIGIPFESICRKLKIKKNIIKIKQFYSKQSIKNFNLIKVYPGVLNLLNKLNKNKIKFSIVTSKDYFRSKKLLKKFQIFPSSIHCPSPGVKGKPSPDLLLRCLKKNSISNNISCYVGDTSHDYIASKKAKLDFIFAEYGYGRKEIKYKLKIKSFKELNSYINKM